MWFGFFWKLCSLHHDCLKPDYQFFFHFISNFITLKVVTKIKINTTSKFQQKCKEIVIIGYWPNMKSNFSLRMTLKNHNFFQFLGSLYNQQATTTKIKNKQLTNAEITTTHLKLTKNYCSQIEANERKSFVFNYYQPHYRRLFISHKKRWLLILTNLMMWNLNIDTELLTSEVCHWIATCEWYLWGKFHFLFFYSYDSTFKKKTKNFCVV